MDKQSKSKILGLDELKENYDRFKIKNDLPEFSQLNELFDIEEIDIETDFLIRKIRRIIADKITNYLRFIEIILNPSNSPLFFFKLIKKLDNKDKEILTELYEKLGRVEVEVIGLDLEYDEKNECEFIKKMFELFNHEIKIKLIEVINKMNNNSEDKERINNGSYFG